MVTGNQPQKTTPGKKPSKTLKKKTKKEVVLTEAEVESNIDRVEEFCVQHGWKLRFSSEKGADEYFKGTITLYEKRKPEILFYIFLHETGHAWLQECDFTYDDRFPELVRSVRRYATVTYKIAKVQEEIEAWEIGRRLAKTLGLRVNNTKFEKIRAECLTSYMNWAGSKRLQHLNNNHTHQVPANSITAKKILVDATEILS